MNLRILHARCSSGAPNRDEEGSVSKTIYLVANRLSGWAVDDIIFLENGKKVLELNGFKNSSEVSIDIHKVEKPEEGAGVITYVQDFETDFGKISKSVQVTIFLNSTRFDELYEDIKLGNSPTELSFHYVYLASELPRGIARNHAAGAPILWDTNVVKRLPIWQVTFQYGDSYEESLSHKEAANEKRISRRQEVRKSVISINKSLENIGLISESIKDIISQNLIDNRKIYRITLIILIFQFFIIYKLISV